MFVANKKGDDIMCVIIVKRKKDKKLIVESQYPMDPRLMLSSRDNDVYFVYGYIQASIMLLNIVHYGKSYFRKDSYIYPANVLFSYVLRTDDEVNH